MTRGVALRSQRDPRPLLGLSICSGIGGIDLGLKLALGSAFSTVMYVEREAFSVALLAERMEQGLLDPAPVWGDLRTLNARRLRGHVDLVFGGIPCTAFSVAGKRRGAADLRDMWPQTRRVLEESEPTLFFLENVPGFLTHPDGFRRAAADLADLGYRVETPAQRPTFGLFTATEVGAPQKRERFFCLAYRERDALWLESWWRGWEDGEGQAGPGGPGSGLADAKGLLGEAQFGEQPCGSGECVGHTHHQGQEDPGAGGGVADGHRAGRSGQRRAEGEWPYQSWDESGGPGSPGVADVPLTHGLHGVQARQQEAHGSRAQLADASHQPPSPEPRQQPQGQALRLPPVDRSLVHTHRARRQRRGHDVEAGFEDADTLPAWPPGPSDQRFWAELPWWIQPAFPHPESAVRGVPPGLPRGVDRVEWRRALRSRVDRLRALGNSCMPQVAACAFTTLMETILNDLHG